jgi:general secretion pathway protein K
MKHNTELNALPVLGNKCGMALLITLTVITLLIAVTVELNRRARATVYATAAARDRLILSQILMSGVHTAFAMLVEDKKETQIDSLQEDWANEEKIKTLLEALELGDGTLTVKISDERSRIQVNALVNFPEGQDFDVHQPIIWRKFLRAAFLEYEHPEESDPVNTIVNSLKDWLDSGDDDAITGLTGAESDYYQDLDPPYACRNGPFTYLSEMLQVKGVTPELFYGRQDVPGISKYLTVSGMSDNGNQNFTFDGKININTAEIPVLMTLLPEETQDLALAINDYRLAKSGETFVHDLSSASWYKNVPGAGDLDIAPELITTSSDLFRVEASASLSDQKMTATVVVKREKDSETGRFWCRVLSWEQY